MDHVIQGIDHEAIEKMLRGFTADEKEELRSYLDRLFQNLRK